jgi:hypothetical protein
MDLAARYRGALADRSVRFLASGLVMFGIALSVAVIGLAILPRFSNQCETSVTKDNALHTAQHFLGAAFWLFGLSGITSIVGLVAPRVRPYARVTCGLLTLASAGSGLFVGFLWAFYPGMCS